MILEGSEEEKLFEAIENKEVKNVKSILNKSTENKEILKLNEKDEYKSYPLLMAIENDKIEIVQLLLEYANQHKIILNLNEINNNGWYPLLWATFHNNIKIVQLLLEYSNQHHIILELNEKGSLGWYPLRIAISYNHVAMVQLLLEIALQHKIILKYEKVDIENKPEFKKLLKNYEKEKEKRKKNEKERLKKEKLESGRQEIERLKREILKKEKLKKERIEKEKQERERLENEINEMKKIIKTLSNNRNIQETETKIINENSKVERNMKYNEKGDRAVVLFSHNGTNSDELILNRGEYLIVTNWNAGDGYVYGYKENDPQQKGKFPSPLVRKYYENRVVRNSQYTIPINDQSYIEQMDQFSFVSEISSFLSSPSTISSEQVQPSAPPKNRYSTYSTLSVNSSHFSFLSSPSTISSEQVQPTAPARSITSLNRIRDSNPFLNNNRNFENNEIESK